MNSLNSVLIEGNLLDDPIQYESGCSFIITSDRFYSSVGEVEKEVSYFTVEAFGRLGESCMNNLKKNRGVRVVGRIKQLGIDSKMSIIAEHIEFKPIKKE